MINTVALGKIMYLLSSGACMNVRSLLICGFFILPSSCKSTNSQLEATNAPAAMRRPPQLPEPSGLGGKAPWGGKDAKKWRPEAIIANAASWLMNEAWAQKDVVDVVIAVPGKYEIGWKNPYDDGQSNAMMHFNQWNRVTPPMIAALVIKSDGSRMAVLWFAREYAPKASYIEIVNPKTGAMVAKLNTKILSSGAVTARWETIPKDLGWDSLLQKQVVFVRPGPNFSDWLPLYFRMPVYSAQDLVKKLPMNQQRYADGKPLLDREGLAQTSAHPAIPFQNAMKHSFVGRYNLKQNGAPYEPEYVHGQFSSESKRPITAVGRGWTWVAEKDQPFKILYTCFARRHPEGSPTGGNSGVMYNEATAPDGGVVSGGGWHVIGEVNQNRPDWFASETIVNDVETAPIMVAGGFEDPAERLRLKPPSGTIAYGLTDVATLRWLWPGEAFVSVSSVGKKNYHWFFFDFDREVCTEEWVYNCSDAQRNRIGPLTCE